MAKFFFCGDTHGSIEHWDYLIGNCKWEKLNTIYQVGDFGYWEHEFKGERYLDLLQQELEDSNLTVRWIDGNHENHEMLREKYEVTSPGEYVIRPNIIHQSRGSTLTVDGVKLVFCGGASSVDKNSRTPYISWWPQEEITYADVENTIANGDCDILVTHDAPLGNYPMNNALQRQQDFPAEAFWPQDLLHKSYAHRKMIYGLVDALRPRLLMHGHYHHAHEAVLRVGADDVKIIGLDQSGTGLKSWKVIDIKPKKKASK